MSTTTELAADLADMIAEDPVTVTVYRRTAGATNETSVDTFEGRIDGASVRVAMESVSTLGTYTRQNHVLVYATDGPDLVKGDEVWATWADGRSAMYRVLSSQSLAWKKEAIMERIG